MIVLLEIEEVRFLLQAVAPLVDPDNPDPFSGAETPCCQAASQLLQALNYPDQIVPEEIEVLLHDDTVLAIARYVMDRLMITFPSFILRGRIHGITVFDNQGTLAIHTQWE